MTKVKVAGLWELGWNTPIKEVDLWEYPLREFEIDEFYMVPVSGIDNRYVQERKSLEDVIEENPDLKVVFVDEEGETPLQNFKHPAKALYVLGKTTQSSYRLLNNKNSLSVRVETKKNKSTTGLLWAHQAITIVLYDRLIKSWQ
jgi:hypothetical protein